MEPQPKSITNYIAILKTIQTWNEYKEVMEHLIIDSRCIKSKLESGFGDTYRTGE